MKKSFCVLFLLISSGFYGCTEKLTPEQKAVKEILTRYTNAIKRGDFATAYNCLNKVSKEYISLSEFVNTWTKNLTEFKIVKFKIENISIVEIKSKIYATAIIKREIIKYADNKKYVERIDYHLCKENGSWGILRTAEIEEKIRVSLYKGEKKKAKDLAMICLEIDPFLATSADEYIENIKEKVSVYLTLSPTQKKEEELKIKNPVIEIKILKVYQRSYLHTYIDFQITNKSDKFLWYWKIEADIFNKKGEYLGHSFANGENLRPGHSVTDNFIFSNVQAYEVASWNLYIGAIKIDLGGGKIVDATKYFKLKEIK